jgi:hypothetical protein
MTAHNWKPVPEHSHPFCIVDRCTACGTYRLQMRTNDGQYPLFTRYSPPNADINNTWYWRIDSPFCEQAKEPQS